MSVEKPRLRKWLGELKTKTATACVHSGESSCLASVLTTATTRTRIPPQMATRLSADTPGSAVVPRDVASVVARGAGAVPGLAGVQATTRPIAGLLGIETVAWAIASLAWIHSVAVVGVIVVSPVPADIRVELVGSLELGVEFLALAGSFSLMGVGVCGQPLGLGGFGVGFGLRPACVGGVLLGDGLALADTGNAFGRLLPDLSGLQPPTLLALARQEQSERYEG